MTRELAVSARITRPPNALREHDALRGLESLTQMVNRIVDRHWPVSRAEQSVLRELVSKNA